MVSNNNKFIACRIPKNKIALELLRSVNFPIAAPSANLSNKISATESTHISKHLKNKSYILDGGSSTLGLESTVIKTFNNTVKILRLGGITVENIDDNLIDVKIIVKKNISKLSPGNNFKHYSPDLPIRINVKNVRPNECLLNFGMNKLKSNVYEYNLSINKNLKEASKNLYKFLHLLDQIKCSGIAVAPIPNEKLGKTINDRLKRASNKK